MARCGHCPQLEEPDRFAALLLERTAAPAAPWRSAAMAPQPDRRLPH